MPANASERIGALLARVLCTFVAFAIFASDARAETMTSAQYAEPVDRYGHFALGRPHEYARIVVTTASGRRLELRLPEDEVFEDLAPRLVSLAVGEPTEILAIVSRRRDGARLVMIRVNGDRLEVSAESPAIGTRMRKAEGPAAPGSLDERMHRALEARREPPRRVRAYLPDRMRAFVQRRLVVPVPVAVAVFIASLGLSLILMRSVSPGLFPVEKVTKIVVAYPAVEVIADQPMTN